MTISAAEIRSMLTATGEEIRDDEGTILGFVVQPARFKVARPYLARGGFLVVTRDEATGDFIGAEYDALPNPKTGAPYPAGHSEVAWRVQNLEDAFDRVMAYAPEV